MRWIVAVLGAALWVASVGCAKKSAEAPVAPSAEAAVADMVGQSNGAGSFLAYSHEATVRLAAADIAGRVAAVRSACMDGRHGTCTVLGEQQSSGQWPGGQLILRAEPKAIEPLMAMASDGGELAQRGTQAEDLADAVRDNGLRQQRLRAQHQRLGEFMARSDVKVEDLIALSNQMAQIESELQGVEQEAAQQERRIRTNLLTLHFESAQVTAQSSRIGEALHDALSVLDSSVAVLVTIVVALLPFALLGAVLAWIIRAVVRRRRRAAA